MNVANDVQNGAPNVMSVDQFLSKHAHDAIDASSTAIEHLKSSPTFSAIEDAYSACRKAAQIVFFARGRFGDDSRKRLDELIENIGISISCIKELARSPDIDPIAHDYAENLQWRHDLMTAMRAGDHAAIAGLLALETDDTQRS